MAVNIAHVQTVSTPASTDGGTTQTRSVTWTQGNLGIICSSGFIAGGAPQITGVEGSSSGTWTLAIASIAASNRREYIYYKENITGGADTVTVTWDGSLDGSSTVTALEYSGVARASSLTDTTANNGGSSTTPTVNLNTATANSLYIGFMHALANSTVTATFNERSERETFMTVGIQDTISSGSTDMTWTLGTSAFWQCVGATFSPETNYSMESSTTLPTDDAYLDVIYTQQQVTDVLTDDGTRVDIGAGSNNPYLIHEYKDLDVNATASAAIVVWDGQADIAPSTDIVRLQAYNRTSTTWVTIDSDNTTAADTDFVLTGTVSPLSEYRNAENVITCRVYQNPTYSSSSSSCRSSSSSSSSCRSSSSSSSSQSPTCWVAAELFGGWYEPKTIAARYYINNMAPNWFRKFYIEEGREIAQFIKDKPILKKILTPLFEYFARRGSVHY